MCQGIFCPRFTWPPLKPFMNLPAGRSTTAAFHRYLYCECPSHCSVTSLIRPLVPLSALTRCSNGQSFLAALLPGSPQCTVVHGAPLAGALCAGVGRPPVSLLSSADSLSKMAPQRSRLSPGRFQTQSRSPLGDSRGRAGHYFMLGGPSL